jgi:hypothetical protein
MSRQAAVQVENNFKGGLVTEASGLNFPENACTETQNCVFDFDGSVVRRPGFDFETDYALKNIVRDKAIVTYLWKNVTGDGDTTLLVKQVGGRLYFYDVSATTISTGILATTINLDNHEASPGNPPDIATKECQFADGNGFLFVSHPYMEPLRIEYDADTETVSATEIEIKIRDFEGIDDGLKIESRPNDNKDHNPGGSPEHLYNLLNQGWTKNNIKSFHKTKAPSNGDVMFLYKDATGKFNPRDGSGGGQSNKNSLGTPVSITGIMSGNTPAPKGHFIFTLWDQDRKEEVHTLSTSDNTSTGYQRPSTCCFFAGRIFWAGLNYRDFNSKIYFSQIVERDEQYGFCYQMNDPTGEDTFDLLPSDGGVISIPEAGTVYKIFTITGGVVVFAANGVWLVSGSTGIGFTAKDYTVTKLTSINAISATSFVDVGGFPAWWNYEGIYLLTSDGSDPKIESLTDQRIKTYYEAIPIASKESARGFFDLKAGVVQWLFRTTAGNTETKYEYNAVLNFNVLTAAFYPWTVSSSDVKIHSIFVPPGAVQEGSFKYLVSYASGSTNRFTFAEAKDFTYKDWETYGVGVDYTSYFISGYKLHGQGIRKFQSNYVRFFSRNSVFADTTYDVQAIWDFANTPSSTGRWSTKQRIVHNNARYDSMSKRLKMRGHGLALQIRVASVTGEPFDLIGWVMLESVNAIP